MRVNNFSKCHNCHTSQARSIRRALHVVVIFLVSFVQYAKAIQDIHLNTYGNAHSSLGFKLDGGNDNEKIGNVVSTGDVNGDGIQDLVIGSPSTGKVYLVIGGHQAESMMLNDASLQGIVIVGVATDQFGASVALGDINGDGLDDIIIGAPAASFTSSGATRTNCGKVYVILGSPVPVSLVVSALLIEQGFKIVGAAENDQLGFSVSSGNLTQNGMAELILGAPGASVGSLYGAGSVYVLRGRAESTLAFIDLAISADVHGYALHGAASGDHLGWTVSCIGDINMDGFDDFAAGTNQLEPSEGTIAVVVMYGGTAGSGYEQIGSATLSAQLSRGYLLYGMHTWYTLSPAGDFDGDLVNDFLIGSRTASPLSRSDAGAVYIMHGSHGTLESAHLTTVVTTSRCTYISGAEAGDLLGTAVGAAGDVNGDGHADIIIGAPGREVVDSTYTVHQHAGTAYVLFGDQSSGANDDGQSANPKIDLATFISSEALGFKILGANQGDGAGSAVLGIRLTSNGLSSDLVIGASGVSFGRGSVSVLYVPGPTATASPTRDPTHALTSSPSKKPSVFPTIAPTAQPSTMLFPIPDLHLGEMQSFGGFEVMGPQSDAMCGAAVSAGDVNGDGVDDLIVGCPGATMVGRLNCGSVYVLYGRVVVGDLNTQDLSILSPSDGFRVIGATNHDYLGNSVSFAGDVNGDGVGDLILGVPNANNQVGVVFVVFGRNGTNRASIDLTAAGGEGYRIFGNSISAEGLGMTVSGAGDVNDDGYDDIIIGAPFASVNDMARTGVAYVLFGASNPSDIDLTDFVSNGTGFRIIGAWAGAQFGFYVSGAGDVNGDGISDVIVGCSPEAGVAAIGEDYVVTIVFGQELAVFDDAYAAELFSQQGCSIIGPKDFYVVNSAGDFNGDGIGDFILGSPGGTAETYVLFGLNSSAFPSEIKLSTHNNSGLAGFLISGVELDFYVGSASAAGDVNGDGVDDLIFGVPPHDSEVAGKVYIFFGHSDALPFPNVNLQHFHQLVPGFAIVGEIPDLSSFAHSYFGCAIAAGDLNGDGLVDIIAGDEWANTGDRQVNGAVYVVNGLSEVPTHQPSRPPSPQPSRTPSIPPTARPTTAPSHMLFPIADIDLSDPQHQQQSAWYQLHGVQKEAICGAAVSAGDVNNDGVDDLIMGCPGASFFSRHRSGGVYVLYGRGGGAGGDGSAAITTDLSASTFADGFLVVGATEAEQIGDVLSFAGDINGDGIGDIIVGAPYTDVVYIIFGTSGAGREFIDLAQLSPDDGYYVRGPLNEMFGTSLSGAGDVNGDGISDILIGAPGAFVMNMERAGKAYLLFGTSVHSGHVLIANITAGVDFFSVSGTRVGQQFGTYVSGAGDVNGDAYGDFIVGSSPETIFGIPTEQVVAAVVLGRSQNATFADISAELIPAGSGYVIYGIDDAYVVGSAGDFNNDGFDDVILGSPGGFAETYILFGPQTTSRSLSQIGSGNCPGFSISSLGVNNLRSASAAGDVNGDGIGDIVLGVLDEIGFEGVVYVLFGHTNALPFPEIQLEQFHELTAGFIIRATIASLQSSLGTAITTGDFNGDGHVDVVAGDAHANFGDLYMNGVVYLVNGLSGVPSAQPTVVPSAAPTLPPVTTAFSDFSLSALANSSHPTSGFMLPGVDTHVGFGTAVSVGDVNGDGIDDIIIGAPNTSPPGQARAGIIYVVFSHAHGTDLRNLTTPVGVRIFGAQSNDAAGYTVAYLGDVNGDGVGDIAVGAPHANANRGVVYVLFGRYNWTADVYLRDINSRESPSVGFMLNSSVPTDQYFGRAVSSAGDVNGDGLQDFVIAAPSSKAGSFAYAGVVYVIFGSSDIASMRSIASLNGTSGFKVFGAGEFAQWGHAIAAAGDINKDGYDDVLVSSGSSMSVLAGACVLFGHSSASLFHDVNLSQPMDATVGFRFTSGGSPGSFELRGIGDINSDGSADFALSVSTRFSRVLQTAVVYVFYGRQVTRGDPSIGEVRVSEVVSMPGEVFQIYGGELSTFNAGVSLNAAGDVNSDGISDFVIGTIQRSLPGAAYVIFGHPPGDPCYDIDLSAFYSHARGFRILGFATGGYTGRQVGAGDFNHDGISDVVVATPYSSSTGRTSNGALFVVFGKTETPTAVPSISPSAEPSISPSAEPSISPSAEPSALPSVGPSVVPTADPSIVPSAAPSASPSALPIADPSAVPSAAPSASPSASPTADPSAVPSAAPSAHPSASPTADPSAVPSAAPSASPSASPTADPSAVPSAVPSAGPSAPPSADPSAVPSAVPSAGPSASPSADPSAVPSAVPSAGPSASPSSAVPSPEPTADPSALPSASPSVGPSASPSANPSAVPSAEPTADPSALPSASPSVGPSASPSADPSAVPSAVPSAPPTLNPFCSPTLFPSVAPSGTPTVAPTVKVTEKPTFRPTETPSILPSASPSEAPSSLPTVKATSAPSPVLTAAPSQVPTRRPSSAPTSPPSALPTMVPTLGVGKTANPSRAPTAAPSLSVEAMWRLQLNSVMSTSVASWSAAEARRSSYYELDVVTSNPSGVVGSCPSWRSLLLGELSLSALQYRPLSMIFTVQETLDATKVPISIVCDNTSVVDSVVESLTSTHTVSTKLQLQCAVHMWKVNRCGSNSVPAVCVDCEDPCALSAHCAASSAASASSESPFTLSPCVAATCPSNRPAMSAVRQLIIAFRDFEPAPTVTISSISPGENSLLVRLQLNSAGSAYCGAYVIDASTGDVPVPASISNIVLQNFVARADAANISAVAISGLRAATDYQVYCFAVSPLGTQQTLSAAVAQTMATATTCCIALNVQTAAAAVITGKDNPNFLTLTLASRPAVNVQVAVNLYSALTGELVVSKPYFPETFSVSALQSSVSRGSTSRAQSTVVLSASLKSVPAGEYTYNVTVSGVSEKQFRAVYANPLRTLSVLPDKTPLPAPTLLSATFASDGSNVAILFGSKTDKGGVATRFSCGLLFDFACADSSSCVWTTSSQVNAFISTGAQCAVANSTISLGASAKIRAECAACDNSQWPTASIADTVTIATPAVAMSPTVAISSPSTIGECDSLVLDLSGSSGNGGRPWSRRTIAVETTATRNVTDLQYFLNHVYQPSPPTPIPPGLLDKGNSYNFVVTLCNFLGKCSQTSRRVLPQSSTVPIVTLPGAGLRTFKRSSSIIIGSDAYFVPCLGEPTRNGLSYKWSLSVNGVEDLTFVSTSKDPSRLRIPGNTLVVNTLYTVSLKVTIASTLQSASASVQIFIESGDLVPKVALGLSRLVRAGQPLTIDASGSYDEDHLGSTVSPASSGLLYAWTCVQTKPVFESACSNVFDSSVSSLVSSVFAARVKDSATNSVAEVTLTILDALGSRSAVSVVTVTIQPVLSPVVSITSNMAASGIINSNQELRLLGSVSFPANYNGTVAWTVDDGSNFALKDATRSPLVAFIPASATVQTSAIYLVIAAGTLPGRSTLTFALSARMASPDGTAAATTLPVSINAAPLPGAFTVSPRNGTEIDNKFAFLAEQWFDSDLPLLYLFAFVSSAGTEVTLRSKSEAAFTSLALSAGLQSANFSVTCVVRVFDSLAAESHLTDSVTVFKRPAQDASRLSATIKKSIQDGASSADGLKQATALGSYLLNEVDCSAAPDCRVRNRKDCFRTPNTCGECSSNLYVGDRGDSNRACVLRSILTSKSSKRALGATQQEGCSQDTECAPFEQCNAGRCVPELQQCKGNCSYPQGICRYVDVNSGEPVPSCNVGATSCEPRCDCAADFVGSETCSVNTTQLLQKQALRTQVIESIASLIALEDADSQTVEGWISSILQASQVPDELSAETSSLLLTCTNTILASATTLGLSADVVLSLLNAVDAVTQAENDRSCRRRRLSGADSPGPTAAARRLLGLELDTAVHNDTLYRTEQTLAKFRAFVSSRLAPDQDAVEAELPQFRVFVRKLSVGPGTVRNISAGLPMSALEALNGDSPSSVGSISLPSQNADGSAADSVTIALTSVRAEPYNRKLGLSANNKLFSNPMTINIEGSTCTAGGACRYEITLPVDSALSTAQLIYSGGEIFNSTCLANEFTAHEYVCADMTVLRDQCDGTASTIVNRCPVTSYLPTCNALTNLAIDSTDCYVSVSTESSIICSCPISGTASSRRRTQDNSEAESQDSQSTTSVSYVAMLTEVQDSFVGTVLTADNLSGSTIERGWSALVTVGTLAVAILFALQWSHRADAAMEKVTPESAKPVESSNKGEKALAGPKSSGQNRRHRMKVQKLTRSGNWAVDRDVQIAEQALPTILSSNSLASRVTDEMKHHHKWFGILFYFSKSFPRVLRVTSLATNVVIMLFIQSITYTLTNPDDGMCETYKNEPDCLAPDSPYATGSSKCYWSAEKNSCALVEPDSDMKVILFVAIFSALICTPLALLVDWMIMNVLSAPTKPIGNAGGNRHRTRTASNDLIEASSAGAALGSRRRLRTSSNDLDIINNSSSSPQMANRNRLRMSSADSGTGAMSFARLGNRSRLHSNRSEMLDRGTSVVPFDANQRQEEIVPRPSIFGSIFGTTLGRNSMLVIDSAAQINAQSDLRELVEDLVKYRETLTPPEKTEFDAVWGLDENGYFKTDEEIKSSRFQRMLRMLSISPGSGQRGTGSVSQRVLVDLQHVHVRLAAEQEAAVVHERSNRDKGKRLLFLFQRDLLPGISGKILESKGQRDNIAAPQVSWEVKAACWLFLGLLNVGMLFYILLFALSQAVHRQTAWALSFALWLVVEILLVSSGTVLFTHVLVPSLIMQDVHKIKMKLVESIRAFNNGVKNRKLYDEAIDDGESGAVQARNFNAASYLFVSTRLAKEWSDLREAQIIAQFRTPWPKQSYQHESNVSKNYSKKYTAILRSGSIIAIFFLTQLLQVPPSFQDMIIQMITTAAMGYTILLHLDLWQIFPLLAFVPILMIAVVVHFIMQSARASTRSELSKTFPEEQKNRDEAGDGDNRVRADSSAAAEDSKFKTQRSKSIWQQISNSRDELDEDAGNNIAAVHVLGDENDANVEEDADIFNPEGPLHMPLSTATTCSVQNNDDKSYDDGDDDDGGDSDGASCVEEISTRHHVTRRQSVQQGMRVLRTLGGHVAQEDSKLLSQRAHRDVSEARGAFAAGLKDKSASKNSALEGSKCGSDLDSEDLLHHYASSLASEEVSVKVVQSAASRTAANNHQANRCCAGAAGRERGEREEGGDTNEEEERGLSCESSSQDGYSSIDSNDSDLLEQHATTARAIAGGTDAAGTGHGSPTKLEQIVKQTVSSSPVKPQPDICAAKSPCEAQDNREGSSHHGYSSVYFCDSDADAPAGAVGVGGAGVDVDMGGSSPTRLVQITHTASSPVQPLPPVPQLDYNTATSPSISEDSSGDSSGDSDEGSSSSEDCNGEPSHDKTKTAEENIVVSAPGSADDGSSSRISSSEGGGGGEDDDGENVAGDENEDEYSAFDSVSSCSDGDSN